MPFVPTLEQVMEAAAEFGGKTQDIEDEHEDARLAVSVMVDDDGNMETIPDEDIEPEDDDEDDEDYARAWDESKRVRGKTTPKSRGGSFAPSKSKKPKPDGSKPRSKSESIDIYHGSLENYLESIGRDGIVVDEDRRNFDDDSDALYDGERGCSVFVSTSEDSAHSWAGTASVVSVGGSGVVIHARIPKPVWKKHARLDQIVAQESGGRDIDDYYLPIKIKPEWLVGWKYSSHRPSKKWVKFSADSGNDFVDVYISVVIDDEPGGEDDGRDEFHRPGGHDHDQSSHGNRSGFVPDATAGYLANEIERNGGFTYLPTMHGSPKQGYVVSLYQDRGVIDVDGVTPDEIQDFADANADLLAANAQNAIGAWFNPENGKVYLDVSRVISDKDDALDLAERASPMEEAVYDIERGETVWTPAAQQSHRAYLTREAGALAVSTGSHGRADRRRDSQARADALAALFGRSYDPSQPRVPAGQGDPSGQWVSKRLPNDKQMTIKVGMGEKVDLVVNPTSDGLARWAGRSVHEMRGILDVNSGNVFVWEAWRAIHDHVWFALQEKGVIAKTDMRRLPREHMLWAEGRGRVAKLVDEIESLRKKLNMASESEAVSCISTFIRDVIALNFHRPGGHDHDQSTHGNRKGTTAAPSDGSNPDTVIHVATTKSLGEFETAIERWQGTSRGIGRGALQDYMWSVQDGDTSAKLLAAKDKDGKLIGIMSIGKPTGDVEWCWKTDNAMVADTFVEVHYLAAGVKGKSIGTTLLKQAFRIAAGQGKGVALFSVTDAIGFYQKLGGMPSTTESQVHFWPPEKVQQLLARDTRKTP